MNRKDLDALISRFEAPQKDNPNPRVQQVVNRLMRDVFYAIEDLDVQPAEFWSAMDYLTSAGRSGEYGLLAAGLGFEHFLDVRADEAEAKAGSEPGATPRTIEGPLYVHGAPESEGFARLDQDGEPGRPLFMQGQVVDREGKGVAGALVEVWHANQMGMYSHFDQSQPAFNLRRSIRTDKDGRYAFRSVMPRGYSVPPNGATERLLKLLGRHGSRPAHVHFFVSAPGYRKLTTQINIQGDPLTWDDFAFATRDGLVPDMKIVEDPEELKQRGLKEPFASIDFDFKLSKEQKGLPSSDVARSRAQG